MWKVGTASSRRCRHWFLTYLFLEKPTPKMSMFWSASATSCQAQQTTMSPSLSLLWLPGRPFRFPLSQVRLGCVEYQSIETLWRWQQHSSLLIFPVSGSPAMDWNLPWIWMEAKILYPFLCSCLSEQTLFGRGRKGTCTGAPMEEALYLPSCCSPEGLARSQGSWLPKEAGCVSLSLLFTHYKQAIKTS